MWQTWKHSPSQPEFDRRYRSAVDSWDVLNPDFVHKVVTDQAAAKLVRHLFADVPEVYEAYDALPQPVLKADFFRYLILLACGGVYSDIDTTALKAIAQWIPVDLQPFGLGVGIEADPDRPDWHQWYARRIQFCQWTIVAKPGHPILVNVVASITEETLERKLRDELHSQAMKTVMESTGPGMWTDTIFDYLNISQFVDDPAMNTSNNAWKQFADLKQPVKAESVLVLPITSFSPGVGHMGSGSTSDPLAYVSHGFSGMLRLRVHLSSIAAR